MPFRNSESGLVLGGLLSFPPVRRPLGEIVENPVLDDEWFAFKDEHSSNSR